MQKWEVRLASRCCWLCRLLSVVFGLQSSLASCRVGMSGMVHLLSELACFGAVMCFGCGVLSEVLAVSGLIDDNLAS